MRYIAQNGKWIPENEYKREPKDTLYFTVFKGGFNPGLGCKVGSKADVKAACSRIEQETGSRPIEIGNEKTKLKPRMADYTLPRGIF